MNTGSVGVRVEVAIPLNILPGLFKHWMALSTRYITIQQISIEETNCTIQWIDIYPMDSVIHLLNNYWGLHFRKFNP